MKGYIADMRKHILCIYLEGMGRDEQGQFFTMLKVRCVEKQLSLAHEYIKPSFTFSIFRQC